MATDVIYGDVTLKNVHTREWQDEVIFDDSGVDPIGVRRVMTFDALVHQQEIPLYGTDGPYVDDGGAFADNTRRLEVMLRKLEQPRKTLVVQFNGADIVRVSPLGRTPPLDGMHVDTNNGPRPLRVQVHHIASDKAFRIRFTVEVSILNCAGSKTGSDAVVLSNRWGIRESMDENFKMSRTISGVLKLAGSPAAANSINPHAFRYLCFPPLEDGFRRKGVTFATDAAANKLVYEVSDEQARYAPPYPATRIAGTHSATTNDGFTFINACSVRLVGPPHCDVKDLIRRALQVAQYRLNYDSVAPNAANDNASRILEASIVETIGDDPTVDISIRVSETTDGNRLTMLHTKFDRMGQMVLPPPQRLNTKTGEIEDLKGAPYRVNKHPIPRVYGYDEWSKERNGLTLALMRCVLQSQCEPTQSLNKPLASSKGEPSSYDRERFEQTPVTAYPDTSGLADPSIKGTWPDQHLSYMYITVSAATEYEGQQNVVRLPVANSGVSGQPTATIVQLCQPTETRIVTVDFERVGKLPEFPPLRTHQIEGNGTIFHPCSRRITILPPRYTANADQKIHRAKAKYVYLGDRELRADDLLPIGRLPIMGTAEPSKARLSDLINESADP